MAASDSSSGDSTAATSAAASAAAFLDEARAKLGAGDSPGALVALRAVAGLAGCPPDSLIDAARMLAQAGDKEAALQCYLGAGTAFLSETKEITRARQALQAGHALDVHNLDIVFMLGQVDVADGRTQDGLAKFIDVLRKSNLKHVPALFEAGCIYQMNGQHDQAMLAFKKVLDRDKSNIQATVRIGQLFQGKDNLNEAISYYIQAANIARDAQHWGTARQIASTVLALDAQNQKARLLLADLDEQGLATDQLSSAAANAATAPSAAAPAQPAAASAQAPLSAAPTAPSVASAAPSPAQPTPAPAAAQTASAAQPAKPASAQPRAPQPTAAKPVAPPPRAPQVPPTPVRNVVVLPQPGGAAKPAPTPQKTEEASAPVVAQVAAKLTRAESAPEEHRQAAPAPPPISKAPPAAPQSVSEAPLAADIERAQQQLVTIEIQRQAAQQDLQLLLTTREELQQALADQRTILETATMRKTELDVQIAAAEAALTEARTAVATAGASADSDKQAVAALAAERASLEATLAQLHAEMETVAKQSAAEQAALRDVVARREKTAGEVASLIAKMQDAKKLTDELETARAGAAVAISNEEAAAKAKALEEQVGALEAQRAEHERKAAAAQEALTAAQAALAALSDQTTQAQTLAEQAQAHAREAEQLRTQRQAEADALAQRLETLNATLKDMEQRAAASPPPPPAAVSTLPNVGPQGAHARAAAHLAVGDFNKAIESYKNALDANPQDAAAAYQAGALLAEHGSDLEAAEQFLGHAAELRPEHAATRYQLALVKARRGSVVAGAEMLSALARADANNGDFVDQFVERLERDAASGDLAAKFRLGVAYRELGRIEEALVVLQSIQHEPEFVVPCLIAIGLCLRRQGLDGAAAKRFAKAIETPGYPESMYLDALYNLGDLYEAKGTQESLALALSSFEELYARDCTYRDIGERVRVVKTNLGSTERTKVKRLPTRVADSQGNQ